MISSHTHGPADELIVVAQSPDYVLATWRDVLIQRIGRQIPMQYLIDCDLGSTEAKKYRGGLYSTIVLADSTAKIPSADVRKEASRLWKETESQMSAHATVLDGEGFWVSALRAVMTGLVTVLSKKLPRSVVSNVDEAIDFVAEHVELGVDEKLSLRDAVSAVQSMELAGS